MRSFNVFYSMPFVCRRSHETRKQQLMSCLLFLMQTKSFVKLFFFLFGFCFVSVWYRVFDTISETGAIVSHSSPKRLFDKYLDFGFSSSHFVLKWTKKIKTWRRKSYLSRHRLAVATWISWRQTIIFKPKN